MLARGMKWRAPGSQAVEVQLEVAALGDRQRVAERVRQLGEERAISSGVFR